MSVYGYSSVPVQADRRRSLHSHSTSFYLGSKKQTVEDECVF